MDITIRDNKKKVQEAYLQYVRELLLGRVGFGPPDILPPAQIPPLWCLKPCITHPNSTRESPRVVTSDAVRLPPEIKRSKQSFPFSTWLATCDKPSQSGKAIHSE